MKAALAGIALASALLVAGADGRLRAHEAVRGPAHHLLYLPSGKYLRVATLGNAPIVADLIYLWSIQYYSNYQIEDRYHYVQHIYKDIITELDPHYFDPYWIGALILSVETKNLDGALALLDKGFAKNPDRWIYPYLAGWECAYARQYDDAIDYFRKASAVPSAPPDVGRLVAGMYQRKGDVATAVEEWERIWREATDPGVKDIAENRARALRRELDVQRLQEAVERYRASRGHPPAALAELVRAGLIDAVPAAPDGAEYPYDRSSGRVGAGPARVIPD